MSALTNCYEIRDESARIGPWRLLFELNRHPTIRLYKAEHQRAGTLALLRVLSAEDAADDRVRDHFLLEANVASKCPLRMLATRRVFESDGRWVAVMEWPDGELLSQLSHPVTATEAADACLDVARSLSVMHDYGLIHGAVRPGSVLVGPGAMSEPEARLLDPGLCIADGHVADDEEVARSSLPHENRQGGPVGPRSDVYGLAILCYLLLGGGRQGTFPATVPASLERWIRDCAAHDPEYRPPTMREAADRLESISHELAETEDHGFGEHEGWFIDDQSTLSDDQMVSLYGYAPARETLRTTLSVFLVLGTSVAGAALAVSAYAGG